MDDTRKIDRQTMRLDVITMYEDGLQEIVTTSVRLDSDNELGTPAELRELFRQARILEARQSAAQYAQLADEATNRAETLAKEAGT